MSQNIVACCVPKYLCYVADDERQIRIRYVQQPKDGWLCAKSKWNSQLNRIENTLVTADDITSKSPWRSY